MPAVNGPKHVHFHIAHITHMHDVTSLRETSSYAITEYLPISTINSQVPIRRDIVLKGNHLYLKGKVFDTSLSVN